MNQLLIFSFEHDILECGGIRYLLLMDIVYQLRYSKKAFKKSKIIQKSAA